ncbi:hypothetical protein BDV10DRAFT_39023 [Aspergillus recurvatus]
MVFYNERVRLATAFPLLLAPNSSSPSKFPQPPCGQTPPQSYSTFLTMVDTPTGSVHRKRQSVFGRLKTALRGRRKDKEPPLIPSESSASELTAKPDAKNGSVNPKTDDSKSDNHDAKDFWQIAYNKLSESDRNTLATFLPAREMDKTYRPVLYQLHAEDESEMDMLVEEFQKTIGVIILLAVPLSLSALAELVEIPEGEISIRLDAFHSVLTIPSNADLPIRTLHLSFHDHLRAEGTRPQKAMSRFWENQQETHGLIARQCLIVMRRHLTKNICKLPSYGTSRTEIDSACITRFFPPALQYACRYWVYHLNQSSALARSIDQVFLFLKEHFLHWLESMSILGIISETVNTSFNDETVIQQPKTAALDAVLRDLLTLGGLGITCKYSHGQRNYHHGLR